MAHRGGPHRTDTMIFDISGGTVRVTPEEVRKLAYLAAQELGTTPIGPVVIIAPEPAGFGFGRMYQSYASAAGRENVGVVRSMEEAQRWLAHGAITPE